MVQLAALSQQRTCWSRSPALSIDCNGSQQGPSWLPAWSSPSWSAAGGEVTGARGLPVLCWILRSFSWAMRSFSASSSFRRRRSSSCKQRQQQAPATNPTIHVSGAAWQGGWEVLLPHRHEHSPDGHDKHAVGRRDTAATAHLLSGRLRRRHRGFVCRVVMRRDVASWLSLDLNLLPMTSTSTKHAT